MEELCLYCTCSFKTVMIYNVVLWLFVESLHIEHLHSIRYFKFSRVSPFAPVWSHLKIISGAGFRGATASAEDAVTYTCYMQTLWHSGQEAGYPQLVVLQSSCRHPGVHTEGHKSPLLCEWAIFSTPPETLLVSWISSWKSALVRSLGSSYLCLWWSAIFSLVSRCQIFLVPARCEISSFILLEHLACVSLGTFSIICVEEELPVYLSCPSY